MSSTGNNSVKCVVNKINRARKIPLWLYFHIYFSDLPTVTGMFFIYIFCIRFSLNFVSNLLCSKLIYLFEVT